MEALQGKIPGMDITKTSGQVGGDVSILLRGSRSIYGSNEPLFIIDGIPGSYSQVSPSDIESVDVLERCFFHRHLWFCRSKRCCHHHHKKRKRGKSDRKLRCLLRIQRFT